MDKCFSIEGIKDNYIIQHEIFSKEKEKEYLPKKDFVLGLVSDTNYSKKLICNEFDSVHGLNIHIKDIECFSTNKEIEVFFENQGKKCIKLSNPSTINLLIHTKKITGLTYIRIRCTISFRKNNKTIKQQIDYDISVVTCLSNNEQEKFNKRIILENNDFNSVPTFEISEIVNEYSLKENNIRFKKDGDVVQRNYYANMNAEGIVADGCKIKYNICNGKIVQVDVNTLGNIFNFECDLLIYKQFYNKLSKETSKWNITEKGKIFLSLKN